MARLSNCNERFVLVISIDGMANSYLHDPYVRMPTLRRIIREGVSAAGMESVFPTATWAIHASMVTGTYPRKQGVLGNWVIDRPNRRVGEHFADRTWNKTEVLRRETWYDAAKRMGWTTASICWPVTRGAETIDFNIPEFFEQELFETCCTASLWKELKAAGLPVECYGDWSKDHARRGPMQDWLTTEIAKYLIDRHSPNLIQMHYLLPDSMQHDYGVRSKEAYWSLEYVDERIGEVLKALDEKGILHQTDVFIVSDHGFVNTAKTFYPNRLFKQKGWLNTGAKDSQVIAVSNGGSGYVYVLENEPARKTQLIDEVRRVLAESEGVGRLFEREDFPSLGLPAEGELDDHSPDFAFEAELDCFVHFDYNGDSDHRGDGIVEYTTKFKGMHGYLPQHEQLKAVFTAAGPSIRSGLTLPEIRIVDIAPTIARLLRTELADTDGCALDDIWKEELKLGIIGAVCQQA
ncbi:MAG: ectonucleotide pyrophosphatase/phosphodiesterase [Paenibacillus macerans]|uniref:alkaline phosphatase family protein n=1 Tax=Paenibacillus macerans TaxID=44252 RepID=UPI0029112937|nr:ectonucleotide pyrophosphatase/phosphodiesterase [Paenibacillus macerans]MDU7473443.1 ectonucleotide pyrophosphatase/phosphodiesterase [Paenibacillus macerans]